jgi:hypothetical protein
MMLWLILAAIGAVTILLIVVLLRHPKRLLELGQHTPACLLAGLGLGISAPSCDNVFHWIGPVGVLAMNSVHGWFSDNKEWIEFIAAAVILWLLMMTGIAVLDLRSAG